MKRDYRWKDRNGSIHHELFTVHSRTPRPLDATVPARLVYSTSLCGA